jgi:hypothetical protein
MINTTDLPEMSNGRRSFMTNLLIGGAAFSAAGCAAVLPAIGRAQEVQPPVVGVSPMMQAFIADFIETSILLAATDATGDAEKYSAVSDARSKALVGLTFHQPANLVELSAKMAAVVEFSEDSERFSLRVLVEDMNRLAEVGK